ncbi:hypothetical protein PoB_005846300 [Plakobranchus ocellatus]|uniref:Uncharacterized protein n=1 Tax=Plakobranchus ocellatus TaxID=259542 RepID=A0AAV4CIZ9_9GAST|nr:hypothetical protein PoB_005846300 [Plakobranchus ocellatus]
MQVRSLVLGGGVGSSPQGDLRFLSPQSGQGAGSGARTCDKRVWADSLTTVPPTPGSGSASECSSGTEGNLRLLGHPPGQGAGTRTPDRRVPADLRADSLTTEPPTPQHESAVCTRNVLYRVQIK